MMTLREFLRPREFTGAHMMAVMVLFFGTIITVNLIMARFAVTTWSGLVVPNTYVASQEFNGKAAEARAIAALGNRVSFSGSQSGFSVLLSARDGSPLRADQVIVTLHRPVGTEQDRDETLVPAGYGRFTAEGKLGAGDWIAHVTARDHERVLYNTAHRIHILADGTVKP